MSNSNCGCHRCGCNRNWNGCGYYDAYYAAQYGLERHDCDDNFDRNRCGCHRCERCGCHRCGCHRCGCDN
ncbi:MAG: hypothetical protein HFK06_03300 [Clostridia bacterium]|nr:hypothetical protein [Clostridia bacterium]